MKNLLSTAFSGISLIGWVLLISAEDVRTRVISQLRHLQINNDDCETALPIILEDDNVTLYGETNIGAKRVGDSLEDCFTWISSDTVGVWYRFTIKGPKRVTVSTCNQADFDTQISVYQSKKGNCDDLTCVAANDDGNWDPCKFTSEVDFGTQNTELFVLVTGWGGDQGHFDLTVTLEPIRYCTNNCEKAAAIFCKETMACSEIDKGQTIGACIRSICNKKYTGSCEGNCDQGYALHPKSGQVLCLCEPECWRLQNCCFDVDEFCPAAGGGGGGGAH